MVFYDSVLKQSKSVLEFIREYGAEEMLNGDYGPDRYGFYCRFCAKYSHTYNIKPCDYENFVKYMNMYANLNELNNLGAALKLSKDL